MIQEAQDGKSQMDRIDDRLQRFLHLRPLDLCSPDAAVTKDTFPAELLLQLHVRVELNISTVASLGPELGGYGTALSANALTSMIECIV